MLLTIENGIDLTPCLSFLMRSFVCSCAVIGSKGCGKSTLIQKLSGLTTDEFGLPTFKLGTTQITVEFLSYSSLGVVPNQTTCVAVLYDTTRAESFEWAKEQIQVLAKHIELFPVRFLIGTHGDLRSQRKVSYQEAAQQNDLFSGMWIETGKGQSEKRLQNDLGEHIFEYVDSVCRNSVYF